MSDFKNMLSTLTGIERVRYIKFYMLRYIPKTYTDDEIVAVLPKLDALANELALKNRLQEGTITNRAIRLFF